jgi:hypothetical protein
VTLDAKAVEAEVVAPAVKAEVAAPATKSVVKPSYIRPFYM